MVVFTCGHCGDSIQKPKVEKHYMTKCRNRTPNLSCMDCFKDFFGNDFDSHTKCVTEEQRYGGKGFVAKEKKGEQKQEAWVDLVQSVLDEQKNAPRNVLRIIEGVSKHQNTPRKKPKFVNFVKNVCGHKTNTNDIEAAWDMLSVKLSQLSTSSQNKNTTQNSPKLDNSVEEPSLNGSDEIKTESTNEINNEVTEVQVDKSKSKKEKKEEKKRKKYEKELKSASTLPEEEVEEQKLTKKEKKMKNKFDTAEADGSEDVEKTNGKSKKNKKRKRADTVNEANGNAEVIQENGKVQEKPQLKKSRAELESLSLQEQEVVADDNSKGKFNWHSAILEVLQKKGELPFKRLQKKVLGEYSECTGCNIDDRIAEKFIKKLKSAPKVKVDKNRVYLEE